MLKLNNQEISSIYFNNQKINRYYFNGVMYEFYKPYIDYKWSNTVTKNGLEEVENSGSFELGLSQYFGQGCWFNGIDQNVTIPINATIQTEIKRVNGVVEINTNTQVLTNYKIYSGSGDKVYKDLYMFNRALTPAEIEKYTNQPNQFFTDALGDNSCILAMPMCEKDKYVRNYKNYSEIPQAIAYTTSYGWVDNEDFTYSVNKDTGWFYLCRNTTPNGLYYVSFEIISITYGRVQFDNEIDANVNATTQGLFKGIIEVKNNKLKFTTGNTGAIATVQNLEVKRLTGIYPVTNYLTTCRTNAQRLPYGLQTSGFKRDSNGLILSKSNFLEADGVGYGNTGWVSRADKDWSIELICKNNKLTTGTIGIIGTDGTSSNNRFRIYAYYHPSSNTRRPHVWIEDQYIAQPTGVEVPDVYLITVTYNSVAKRYRYYLNGTLVGFRDIPNFKNSLPLKIFQYATYQVWETPLRHIRIHEKPLTQEEITNNFNAYDKLGLFTESGLPPEPTPTIPQYGIVDEEGNYLIDEDGNFITWE